jgi:hypothetical protein
MTTEQEQSRVIHTLMKLNHTFDYFGAMVYSWKTSVDGSNFQSMVDDSNCPQIFPGQINPNSKDFIPEKT